MAGGIRLTLSNKNMGAQFKAAQGRNYALFQRALGKTARAARDEIKQRGDVDISNAGNFGRRWLDGFKSTILLKGNQYTIRTSSDTVGFNVFEFSATIRGKPLLWIPLSFAGDAQGVLARDFPGGLFRVDRKKGKPLLLSVKDRKPKYFGTPSVRIPRKFHIRDIIRNVAGKMEAFYRKALREG